MGRIIEQASAWYLEDRAVASWNRFATTEHPDLTQLDPVVVATYALTETPAPILFRRWNIETVSSEDVVVAPLLGLSVDRLPWPSVAV